MFKLGLTWFVSLFWALSLNDVAALLKSSGSRLWAQYRISVKRRHSSTVRYVLRVYFTSWQDLVLVYSFYNLGNKHEVIKSLKNKRLDISRIKCLVLWIVKSRSTVLKSVKLCIFILCGFIWGWVMQIALHLPSHPITWYFKTSGHRFRPKVNQSNDEPSPRIIIGGQDPGNSSQGTLTVHNSEMRDTHEYIIQKQQVWGKSIILQVRKVL